MQCFDGALHNIPILYTSLVDSRYLIWLGEKSFPPKYALNWNIIGTGNKVSIEEMARDTSSFRFGGMCDVDK